jgi:hypothetical protein
MADQWVSPSRCAPANELPPYAYVPGHGLPHPVNDPRGHLYATRDSAHEPPISGATLSALPTEPDARLRGLTSALTGNTQWLFAIDLFNEGFYWEAHEVWEKFWHALGRTTPEARFVQGLIHLAAACVKIREGKPAGVKSHATRARKLMGEIRGEVGAANVGGEESGSSGILGFAPESIAAIFAELEAYRHECWQTSKFPVVKVLSAVFGKGVCRTAAASESAIGITWKPGDIEKVT